jgi:zinc transport system ATP-binding protein
MAGLAEVQDSNIFHLSGGQRQRAVIARVLASQAEFILLDEPLVGIDRESRNSLLKFLDTLCHEGHKTILMISHDIAAIQQASHRMIFLEERIRYDGESSCFPDMEYLASLRGIQPLHEAIHKEDKLYQLTDIEDNQ